MANKKSIGLPGGPNEYITDISEYLSVEGYKFNSPDVNNPFNIIESGSISMQDVDFPVLGMDNLGNQEMMQPGMNYEFPGDQVFELPMAQDGLTEFELDDRTNKINTKKGYDESKLYDFIKDKYRKVDTSLQKTNLVDKLSSAPFRERYKKNVFNISGENLSEEELTSRINSQIDFTGAGPDFHVKMPFVTNSSGSGYQRGMTPYINPFSGMNKDGERIGGVISGKGLSYARNQGMYYGKHPEKYGDVTNSDFPELTKYPYVVQLADKNDPYIMGDRDVVPFDTEGSTIVHEYAHSYNTEDSPLFKPEGEAFTEVDRGNYNSETERYDYSGTYDDVPGKKYKNWLSNLFGEDYFTKEGQPYDNWAMKPWEISSIKAQTEDKLVNARIWDNTKGKFNEVNLDRMLTSNRYNPEGPEKMHLDKLGYSELSRINYNKKKINRSQERFNSDIDRNSSDYIMNNIIDPDGNRPAMDIDAFNIIFNNSQSDLRANQKYSDFNSLVDDSNNGSRGKKKRATEILNTIYSDVKNQLNQGYDAERIELEKNFDERKKEVLPKMKMYFNEIAMDDVNQPVMAQYGNGERSELKEYDSPGFFEKAGDILANPVTAFGYTARGESIPDRLNVGNPNRNNFDMAVDIFNPFAWAQYGENSINKFGEGEILEGALNALGALPFIPATLASVKKAKAFSRLKDINKIKDGNKLIRPPVVSPVDNVTNVVDDYFSKNVSSVGDNTPVLKDVEKTKLQKIIDKNIAWVKSDEYLSKRMTNTGESKQEILDQVTDYIADFKKMPIKFYSWGDEAIDGIKGSYTHPSNVKNKGFITMGRGSGQLDDAIYETFDHEVKHALSPSGKYNKLNENFDDAIRALDEEEIYTKILEKTTTREAADKAVGLLASIVKARDVPKIDQGATSVYRNYPKISIKDKMSEKWTKYMNDAPEQQVRLLRAGDWMRKTFGWDGTKAGMTDKMLEKTQIILNNNRGSNRIPTDVKELLNSSNSTASHFRDVVSQAWSAVPMGVGAGVLLQQKYGGDLPEAQSGNLGKLLKPLIKTGKKYADDLFRSKPQKPQNFDDLINLPDEEFAKFTSAGKDHWKLVGKKGRPEFKDRLMKLYNGMFKPNDNVMPAIEKTQKEMASFFNTPEYKQRLINGLNISTKEADDIVRDMTKQINETKFTFNNSGSEKFQAQAASPLIKGGKANVVFTDIVNKYSPEQLDGIIRHELGHVGSYLKTGNNKHLAEQFPKLDLQERLHSTWSNNKNLIDYYSTPDEIRQRGLVALDFIKKNNTTIDNFLNISYDDIVRGQMQGKIPREVQDLVQYYKPEQLGPYLKKMFSVVGTLGLGDQLTQKKDGGPITPELLMKQAYVESNWDPSIVNSKGYTGLGQIGPDLVKDYRKANKIEGSIDLLDPKVNSAIQSWSMNELINSSFINKGDSTDEVKLAKALAAYNWGRGNMSDMLVKQKAAGVDIYKSLDWLDALPKETLDYYKMITTDDFNPEKRPLVQQDYLKALQNDSIIQNYYKKTGGESEMISVYKDYVNGKSNNKEGKKVYDKLNRIHLKDARSAGMAVPNYIMTYV